MSIHIETRPGEGGGMAGSAEGKENYRGGDQNYRGELSGGSFRDAEAMKSLVIHRKRIPRR
jgi:hypothetical protein